MHKGEVSDSDEDEIALHVRAQGKHPTVGILIKKVDGSEDVWTIRSPRAELNSFQAEMS